MSNSETAKELAISECVVRFYVGNPIQKVECKSYLEVTSAARFLPHEAGGAIALA